MKFSLRTLLLTVTMLPPAIGFFVLHVWRQDSESPLRLPDPILVLGIVGWLVAYAVLVREPSQESTNRRRFTWLRRFRVSFVEVLQLLVLVGMSFVALSTPVVEVVTATRLIAFCLAAACLIVACKPRSRHRWSAVAALAAGLVFYWLAAEQTAMFLVIYFRNFHSLAAKSPALISFVDISSVILSVFSGIFLGYLVRSMNAPEPDERIRSENYSSSSRSFASDA